MKRRLPVAAIGLAPLLAIAHHGRREYGSTRLPTLTGMIVESGDEYPHGWVRLASGGRALATAARRC